ncbi:peptide ABC transporter permease [Endozoicomonas sp. (ex Bugula neritina AB1)]|nr:peptide ABC transporter permease [Endozoicomonas sp. (ex Bugula neritina AB1)]
MSIMTLALSSLKNRKTTALLTILSIAVSVALLLGVERIRVEAKNSFTSTISGTDLIIGARNSSMNLLLYSVFHIGNATNNISWKTYTKFSKDSAVKWVIPISLGDSHRGYRVLGTNQSMFSDYRYGAKQSLTFAEGSTFKGVFDAVIGSEVAAKLGYQLNQKITLSHGVEKKSLQSHDDKPFQITGILNPTGTPLDRVIMTSLEGIEALHIDWMNGAAPIQGLRISSTQAENMNLQPESVTAFFVGLKSRIAAFSYQRRVNDYQNEALTAILPGVALQELWKLIGSAETALMVISIMVVVAGLIGMLTTILTSLNERRREMAILRSVGAQPRHIFQLMIFESVFYAIAGTLFGFVLMYSLLLVAQPILENTLGLHIAIAQPGAYEIVLAAMIMLCAVILGAIPAWRAYRNSLADGLTIRV